MVRTLFGARTRRAIASKRITGVRIESVDPEGWGDAARVYAVRASGPDLLLVREPSVEHALQVGRRIAGHIGVPCKETLADAPRGAEPLSQATGLLQIAEDSVAITLRPDERALKEARLGVWCAATFLPMGLLALWVLPLVWSPNGWAMVVMVLVVGGGAIAIGVYFLLEFVRRSRRVTHLTVTDRVVEIGGTGLLGQLQRSFPRDALAQVHIPNAKADRGIVLHHHCVALWIRGQRPCLLAYACSSETRQAARDAILFALARHSPE